ncbi:MAG: hypothetical protein M3R36_06540 [Bacteroidota bacterium]|nr:hypothetical protein [Bacteroidota bacterium]
MKFKYLLCIFLFSILRGISFCQDYVVNNLSSVDNLINESFIPLSNKLLTLGKENFYGVILTGITQEQEYLVESLRNSFRDFNLIIGEDSDSIDYKIIFKNPVINTKYKKIFADNILGTKKVRREVTVSYGLDIIKKKDSSLVYSQNFDKKIKDNFDLDKINSVEDNRYPFSQSILPEESTADNFFYPAIIIFTSAAAIILFFVIRSN